MEKRYVEQVRQLRQRIPVVGLTHGLRLLALTGGNLAQAEQLVQEEYQLLIQQQTGLAAAAALEKLRRLRYDLDKVLEEVAREQHTETELVLRRYATRKAEALPRIFAVVARNTPLAPERNAFGEPWLALGRLTLPNPAQQCVVVLAGWLDYEEYEGFDYALRFWLEVVAGEIAQQLQLPLVADCLRTARRRQAYIETQAGDGGYEQAVRAEVALRSDPEFQAAEQEFEQHRQLLLETLYDYVQEHVAEFP